MYSAVSIQEFANILVSRWWLFNTCGGKSQKCIDDGLDGTEQINQNSPKLRRSTWTWVSIEVHDPLEFQKDLWLWFASEMDVSRERK